MSSLLGTLSVMLQVSTVGTTKAIQELRTIDRAAQATTSNIGVSSKNINASLMSIGRTLTQFVSLPLGLLEVISTKSFATFEYNLSKVTGLVGIAAQQTQQWGDEILNMSSKVSKGTKDLSNALYFVTTGGIRGAESIEVLDVAARSSAVGLGETALITDMLVSAMNAYGKENLNAAKAGDILLRSVREGKAEADQMAVAMGVVFPIASKLGVSYGEVGAGMAAMTRTGTTAATSAMQLRRILFSLLKPAEQSESALKAMGTSSAELRNNLQNNGLLDTLMEIKNLMDTYGEDMVARVFPNIRALAGVFDILGENLEENKALFKSIAESGGDLDAAFENVSNTFQFKMNSALAAGNVMLVRFGESIARILIPFLESLAEKFENVADWFDRLTKGQQNFIVKTALLITTVGPLAALLAGVITIVKGIGTVFGFTTSQTALQTAAINAQTAAIEKQTAAMTAQKIVNEGNIASKSAQVVTTTTLANAERKSAAAAAAATAARTSANAASSKYIAAELMVAKAKGKATIANSNAANAEIKLASALKTSDAYTRLQTQSIAANNAFKKAQIVVTNAEAEATMAATTAAYRKQRADVLAAAAARAKAEVDRQATVILNAQAVAAERARLANSKFYASTGASLLMTKQFNAAQLKNVQILNSTTVAANSAAAGFSAFLSGIRAVPVLGWIALGAAIYYVVKELTKLTELEKLQNGVKNETAKLLATETGALNAYLTVANNEALSRKMRLEAMEKINEISPTYLGNIRLGTLHTKEAKDAIDAYNSSLEEQIRIKVLQESLIDLEKKYQEEVRNGANAKLHWTKMIEEHQRSFVLGYMGHSDRMNDARDAQIKKHKEEYEASKKYIQEQLEDRSKLTDITKKQFDYAQTQIGKINIAEKQYQNAVKLSAEEKANAVAKIVKDGKTQEAYEKEINKVIKEHDKNLDASVQKYRNNIKLQIDLNKEIVNNARDQRDYYSTLIQTDSKLTEYRESIVSAATKRERKEYASLYDERRKQLDETVKKNVSVLDTIITDSENAVKQLEALFEPIEVQIHANIEMNKIKQTIEESLANLEIQEQLLWAPDLPETERIYKKLTEQAEIYKKALESINTSTNIELSDEDVQKIKRSYENIQSLLPTLKINVDLTDIEKQISSIPDRLSKGKSLFGAAFDPLKEEYNILEGILQKAQDNEIPITDKQVQYAIKRFAELHKLTEKFKKDNTITMSKVSKDVDEALRVLERSQLLFGDSIDVTSEKLDIYQNALDAIAKAEEKNIKIGSAFVTNIKSKVETLELAVEAIKRLEQEERQLTETWLKQQDTIDKNDSNIVDLEQTMMAAQSMANTWKFSQMGLTNSLYDSGKALDKFDKIIDVLKESIHLLGTDGRKNLEGLIALFNEWANSEYSKEIQGQLDEIDKKLKVLGPHADLMNEKVRLLEQGLRKALSAPLGNSQEGIENWVGNVNKYSMALSKAKIEAEALTSAQDGMVDMLMEIGKSMMGVEDAWENMGKIALGVLNDIIKAILKELVLSMFRKKASDKVVQGKLAEAAASAVSAAASTGDAVASSGNAVAKAVETGASFGPAMVLMIPLFLGAVMMALQSMNKAKNMAKMAKGGIVPSGYPNDSYPAMLSSGETVIPPHKLPEFERRITKIKLDGEWKVKGRDLYYVVKEEERRVGNSY